MQLFRDKTPNRKNRYREPVFNEGHATHEVYWDGPSLTSLWDHRVVGRSTVKTEDKIS